MRAWYVPGASSLAARNSRWNCNRKVIPMKADASPTKDFFIYMITKDIPLDECILDLLDNCIDGANNDLQRKDDIHRKSGQGRKKVSPDQRRYNGYWAEVTIGGEEFIVADNCGGISLDDAVNYAFHFGRRYDAPPTAGYSIGLYGIGMKRAMFKMGKDIAIESSTETDSFSVKIDVAEWARRDAWDFDLEPMESKEPYGTRISIKGINKGIDEELADPVFVNQLIKSIARGYSLILQRGFKIKVNGTEVKPYIFYLRESEEFKPVKRTYIDDETGVEVEIVAGLAGLPPNDISAEAATTRQAEAEYYGWFVLGNDRVVLAADKGDDTVWGDEKFPIWHWQYTGFLGIASFRASDPGNLPWTTTKRALDATSPLYRRAVTVMKEVTRPYLTYTHNRRADESSARVMERRAARVPFSDVAVREQMVLPRIGNANREETVNITYQKPKAEVQKVAKALGNANMSNKQVGIETFDYYRDNETED